MGFGKTYPDSARSNTAGADTNAVPQGSERTDKSVQAVLRGKVEGGVDAGCVARDAADEDDAPAQLVSGPVANGELAQPGWVSQVHVDDGIVAWGAVGGISRLGVGVGGRLGRLPEAGPLGFEETCSRDDDVDGGEALDGLGPEGTQIYPRGDVGPLENERWLARGWWVREPCEEGLDFGSVLDIPDYHRVALV